MNVIDFYTRKPIERNISPEKTHIQRLLEDYSKFAAMQNLQSAFMMFLDEDGDFYVHVNAISIDHLLRGSMLIDELKKEIKDQTYPSYAAIDEEQTDTDF